MKNILTNFKAMPLGVKILFIFSLWSFFITFRSFFPFKPTGLFFNSYSVLINFFSVIIFLKRSYRWLIYYWLTSLVALIYWFISQKIILSNVNLIIIFGTVLTMAIIALYLFKQKKYFNQP